MKAPRLNENIEEKVTVSELLDESYNCHRVCDSLEPDDYVKKCSVREFLVDLTAGMREVLENSVFLEDVNDGRDFAIKVIKLNSALFKAYSNRVDIADAVDAGGGSAESVGEFFLAWARDMGKKKRA
ncbi:hypothetical protein GF340_02780 [Candidatus Peregrinibacteria bacterium]|nr:hypothetical protein [Candidatus Peregrinibacteria bacterium]